MFEDGVMLLLVCVFLKSCTTDLVISLLFCFSDGCNVISYIADFIKFYVFI